MPKIVGDYKIIKTLGEGNFSKVKKVVNIKTDKLYSMKIIHFPEIKNQVNESQIRRRVEFMSKYSHPGIVKLRAIMHSKNSLFLVFDLAEGELFNTLARSGPLHEDVARRYFQQLIDILSFIKSRDASHRDLKSENLLVDSSDNLVISDFIFSNMTKKSDIEEHKEEEEENDEEDGENNKNALKPLKKTLRYYTAPEVFHNEGYISPEADVWSAGVILYAMLTGDLPFDALTPDELEKKIKNCKVNYPPNFPPKAQNLLKRIFIPEPEKRITLHDIKKDQRFNINYNQISGKDRRKTINDIEVSVHYSADTISRSKKNDENESVNVFELIARLSGISIDGLVNDSVPIKSITSFTSSMGVDELIKKTNKMLEGYGARVRDSKDPKVIKTLIPICSKEVYLRIEFTKITDDLSLIEINRMKGGQIEFLRLFKLIKTQFS